MTENTIFNYLQERRKHERIDRNFMMHYSSMTDLSTFAPAQEARLLDIGGGGARFLTTEALTKQTQLVIGLEIPGWHVDGDEWTPSRDKNEIGSLTVIGQVMWQKAVQEGGGYETGIRFTGQITLPAAR